MAWEGSKHLTLYIGSIGSLIGMVVVDCNDSEEK